MAKSVLVNCLGERGRLARTGRRPANQIEPASNTPLGSPWPRDEAIGGTPMAATGTVALPIPIESFRLSRYELIGLGERGRLARTGRRPADQIERSDIAPNGSASPRAEAIGGTPMAATGTVAIPIFNCVLAFNG